MTKLAKEKQKMHSSMHSRLQISVAIERIMFFSACCFLFMHTLACLWILMAYEMETQNEDNWIVANGFLRESKLELYIIACYFVIQTITTVGYGDQSLTHTNERIMGIITMIIGTP